MRQRGTAAASNGTPASPHPAQVAESLQQEGVDRSKAAYEHGKREGKIEAETSEFIPKMNEKHKDDVGPGVFKSTDDGEEVTMVWGEELFTPVQYNSFRHGPFSGTTKVRPGETRRDAERRLFDELREFAKESFKAKVDEYLTNLAAAKGLASQRGIR